MASGCTVLQCALQAWTSSSAVAMPFAAMASSGRLLGAVSGLAGGARRHAQVRPSWLASPVLLRAHTTATPHASIAGGASLSHVRGGSPSPSSSSFASSKVAPHPGMKAPTPPTDDEVEACWRPVYDTTYLEQVKPSHVTPERLYQRIGYSAILAARWIFDRLTGYGPTMTEAQWLQRMIFLETIAGVPGMVAGVLRHLKSLRSMKRDHGWIHTLLQEAENERMHLLTFFELRKPGALFRASIIVAQGVFWNLYFIGYLLSPRTCHAAVGFLEEEAVKTYTHALQEIDAGRLWKDRAAPPIACEYWGLAKGASMRDLILAVRADEACHAHVNHTLSGLPANAPNPFAYGASQLP